MTSPRAEPDRVAKDDEATGPRHAHHFVGHSPWVRDVLGDVGRVGDIKRTGGEGQIHAVALNGSHARCPTVQSHFAGVGVECHVSRPRRLEGILEEPRTSPDIKHEGTVQRPVRTHLSRRIAREISVEAIGVALFDTEGLQQVPGPSQRRLKDLRVP